MSLFSYRTGLINNSNNIISNTNIKRKKVDICMKKIQK